MQFPKTPRIPKFEYIEKTLLTILVLLAFSWNGTGSPMDGTGAAFREGPVAVLPPLDSDGDGISDDTDEDDDNDGIPDLFEENCEMSEGFGAPPPTVPSAHYATSLYSDYDGFWSSSSGAVNPVAFDSVSTLLAFTVGARTYATGVSGAAMIDADTDGLFDTMDTDGDGTGDLAVEGTEWTALRPVTKIKSGIRLEARAIDGSTANATGPLLTSGGLPFNPYLHAGERGLDMAYAIANIGNTWFFRLGGTGTPAYGDGEMDILLTQGAQLGTGSNYNRLHLLDVQGNYLGNGVEVDWNSVPVVGNSLVDQYNEDGSVSSRNVQKELRFAGVELSEFGLTPEERSEAVIFRLEISANADPVFFAVNQASFATRCAALDSDGDGLANSIDLDSDNDGIFDAVEAGHGADIADGRVTGPVGAYGVPDAVQGDLQWDNGTIAYELRDSDDDGVLDFLSPDSDADGCADVLEAGFADGDGDGALGSGPVSVGPSGAVTGQGGYTDPDDGDANGTPDFREAGSGPVIALQPRNKVMIDGRPGTLSVESESTSRYRWQVSTDGGTEFSDIADSGPYSGSGTAILAIDRAALSMEGYLYRAVLDNDGFACGVTVVSEPALLKVRAGTVIMNRGRTYRVRKEGP